MTIELELQVATDAKTLPHPSQFREWVSSTLWNRMEDAEMTIRIVDTEEMVSLNEKYRKKTGPTNVLSFPTDIELDIDFDIPLLGDVIICAPIVEEESKNLNIDLLAHWAHLVVHGTLHLLGFDHETKKEAIEMEKIETDILVKLGFAGPYVKK